VEAILRACEDANLTRRISLQAFEADPKGVILAEYDHKKENDQIRSEMEQIGREGEDRLLAEIDGVV
jgi:hypothetical protein